MRALPLAGAFVRRDFRVEKTYRLAFLTQLAGAGTTLLSAGFLSRLVPDRQPELVPFGGDYFTFVLIGTAALSFFSVALSSFASNLGEEQQHGTLESLLVSPNDPRLLLACGAAYPFLFATFQLVLYIGAGAALFGADIPADRLGLAAGMLMLNLVVFSALGLAAAAVIVVTKRAGVVIGLTASVFALLGGVLYPISVLPRPLQLLAWALPMSHGLEGVRLTLVEDLDGSAVARDAVILVVSALVLIPAALQGFRWAIDRARRTGSLGQY